MTKAEVFLSEMCTKMREREPASQQQRELSELSWGRVLSNQCLERTVEKKLVPECGSGNGNYLCVHSLSGCVS